MSQHRKVRGSWGKQGCEVKKKWINEYFGVRRQKGGGKRQRESKFSAASMK